MTRRRDFSTLDWIFKKYLRFDKDILLTVLNNKVQKVIYKWDAASNEVDLKVNLAKAKGMYNDLIDVQEYLFLA